MAKRKKPQSSLKKNLKNNYGVKYFSKIIVSIASIGFISIAIMDTIISDKNENIDRLIFDWEELRFDGDQSLREYYGALDYNNQTILLSELKGSNEAITEANRGFLMRMRQAIIVAYKAAMDKNIDKITLDKINKMNNYDELLKIYTGYLNKFALRGGELVQNRKSIEKEKYSLELIKIWSLYIFILLMTMGFIIEIHLLRKENQNIISNSSLTN